MGARWKPEHARRLQGAIAAGEARTLPLSRMMDVDGRLGGRPVGVELKRIGPDLSGNGQPRGADGQQIGDATAANAFSGRRGCDNPERAAS